MRLLFLLQLNIIALMAFGENTNPNTIRMKFYASVDDSKKARLLLEEFENSKNSLDALEQGYKAAVRMVMAKHSFNPYSKLKYFIDGKNELENAINTHPKFVELRLIRFAIQSNVPSFLGYGSNIMDDKKYLIENVAKLQMETNADTELIRIIKQYLTESKYCTALEKQNIKKI